MAGSAVLVVAAHPDDEVLGCGGTIARHAAAGDVVSVMILGEGATARPEGGGEASAAAILGAQPPVLCGLPDNRLDSIDLLDVIRLVEEQVQALMPTTVYTHHGGDLNRDHRIVHEAVVTACRPLPGSSVRHLFAFETPSITEWGTPGTGEAFRAVRFVGISETWDAKRRALDCYAAEMRPFPHARSVQAIEALAQLRGSQVDLAAAEAFEVLREVEA